VRASVAYLLPLVFCATCDVTRIEAGIAAKSGHRSTSLGPYVRRPLLADIVEKVLGAL